MNSLYTPSLKVESRLAECFSRTHRPHSTTSFTPMLYYLQLHFAFMRIRLQSLDSSPATGRFEWVFFCEAHYVV